MCPHWSRNLAYPIRVFIVSGVDASWVLGAYRPQTDLVSTIQLPSKLDGAGVWYIDVRRWVELYFRPMPCEERLEKAFDQQQQFLMHVMSELEKMQKSLAFVLGRTDLEREFFFPFGSVFKTHK